MLHMCPIDRLCTSLHLTCPYCKNVIENIDRLKKSSYYAEQSIKLLTHQLMLHMKRNTPYRGRNLRTSQESIFTDSDESE